MTEPGAGLWEKWRAIVSEQIASGQSVAAFCKERGVTSSQVFAWKKRLREAEKGRISSLPFFKAAKFCFIAFINSSVVISDTVPPSGRSAERAIFTAGGMSSIISTPDFCDPGAWASMAVGGLSGLLAAHLHFLRASRRDRS